MTKDVAVVHWTESGKEKLASVGTIQLLSQMIEFCEKKGYTYYVCLTSLDTIIPISSHKPAKAFNSLMEYVGKADNSNSQHRAFRETTRIDRIHHPPTQEQVKKAYGH